MRFRYRTAALVGQWRDAAERAAVDAVTAGQADLDSRGSLAWRIPGRIEIKQREEQAGSKAS